MTVEEAQVHAEPPAFSKKFVNKSSLNEADAKTEDELLLKELEEERIEIQPSSFPLFDKLVFLVRLFTDRKFYAHRIVGLFYIVQWTLAAGLYAFRYDLLRNSMLIWSVPVTGLAQSITAALTFTFLSKNDQNSGYFSDKRTVSYGFVLENSFFSLQLVFGFLYFDPYFYELIKKFPVIEACFVFMPFLFRDLWPRTTFRDAMDTFEKNTQENKYFMRYSSMLTKYFYIWAKHYIGFFLNYARFLGRIGPKEEQYVLFVMLMGSYSITFGIFLHTLKFKKYIEPRLSMVLYIAGYLSTFVSYYKIFYVFFQSNDLFVISLTGLAINFLPRIYQHVYQAMVMAVLFGIRYNYLSETIISDTFAQFNLNI